MIIFIRMISLFWNIKYKMWVDSVKFVNNNVRSLFRRDVDIKSVYNVLRS